VCFKFDTYSWVIEGIVTKNDACDAIGQGCVLQHSGFGGGGFLHSFNQLMRMMMIMMIMMIKVR